VTDAPPSRRAVRLFLDSGVIVQGCLGGWGGAKAVLILAASAPERYVVLADAVDRVKVTRGDRPLIVVGGGSVLVPDRVPGVREVIRPDHHDVANAIGAAIAAVSGQVDRIFHPGQGGRRQAIDEAQAEACDQAVRAGADPEAVEIVEMEELPLAYLTNPAVRIRVKAAGPLSWI